VQCSDANLYQSRRRSRVYLVGTLGVMGILAGLAGSMMPAVVAKFFFLLLICVATIAVTARFGAIPEIPGRTP